MQGLRPLLHPTRRGCAPSSALLPLWGRSAPSTPGDFPVAGKVTNRRAKGCALWNPPVRGRRPFPRSLHASRRATFYRQNKTDLPLWVGGKMGVLLLPKLYRGHTLSCQTPWRGRLGCVACGLPGVAPLSGGSGNAAGGTTVPPTGVQGALPPGTPLPTFVVKRKEARAWAG